MRRIVFFAFLVTVFVLTMGHSRTGFASNSAYFVQNINVDALAESAVKARNKAFLEAQKKAFMVLATRFKSADEMKTIKPPKDTILGGMIQDFEVTNEQLSTKRYRGTYAFRFKAAAVQRYFGSGPVYYTAQNTQEKSKILIVPYYQEGKEKPVLEKAKNRYLTTLKAEKPKNDELIVVAGDIPDMTDVAGRAPDKLSYQAIQRLKARYQVDTVVVVLANANVKKPQTIRLDFYRTDRGRVELSQSMDVPPKKIAAVTYHIALQPPPEPEPEPEMAQEESPYPTETLPDTMRENPLSDDTGLSRSDAYPDDTGFVKPQPQPQPSLAQSGSATLRVFFTGMPEWIAIQRKINGAAGVKGLRIKSLKTNQVEAVMSYTDWDRVVSSLSSAGIALQQEPSGVYIVKQR